MKTNEELAKEIATKLFGNTCGDWYMEQVKEILNVIEPKVDKWRWITEDSRDGSIDLTYYYYESQEDYDSFNAGNRGHVTLLSRIDKTVRKLLSKKRN